jgi:hypothetical protein
MNRAHMADCMALSNAFAYHMDHKNYDALAELFVPRGVFVRTGIRLEGRPQILSALSKRPADQFTRHITSNHYFTHMDDERANAVCYNLSYFAFDSGKLPMAYDPQRVFVLDFVDVYVNTGVGWRFLERDARAVMIPEELRRRLPPEAMIERDPCA